MTWYRNHYHCGDCGTDWEDEWSCCSDDECPVCGSGDWSPIESEDLTEMIFVVDGQYALFRSPDAAGDSPAYVLVALFSGREQAEHYMHRRDTSRIQWA
jgi:hypothetical protein